MVCDETQSNETKEVLYPRWVYASPDLDSDPEIGTNSKRG